MGNVHARQYRKMPDVELCFLDRDEERSHEFQKRWDAESCGTLERLLQSCDILDICLPTDMHLELGMQAIAAGKAVFMEKPITRTLEEGAQLVNAAAKAGTPLMLGHVVRFFPEFSEGNRLVRSGAVGKPAAARTRRGGLAPTKGANNWFMDHHRSGGVLIDLAIHDFDWLRWTLGEVKHLYSRSIGAKTMQGPDYALTTLTFDSGAVAHVEATWMDPGGFRTTFEVAGSDGLIEFDSRNTPSLRTHAGGKSMNEGPMSALDDPYYREIRGFIDAVGSGSEPPVTGHDGLMALSIALAALESAQTGNVVAPAREF
jgi:predicted dehydrogenase